MNHTAELIAVGTELLLGHIANLDAQILSQGLSALGITVHYHTVGGDHPPRPAAPPPGASPLALPRQQLVHPVPAHRHSPSLVRDLISLDSIPFPPGFVNGGGALFPEKRIDPPREA